MLSKPDLVPGHKTAQMGCKSAAVIFGKGKEPVWSRGTALWLSGDTFGM